jgi:hypothetical protein
MRRWWRRNRTRRRLRRRVRRNRSWRRLRENAEEVEKEYE